MSCNKQEVLRNILGAFAEGICPPVIPGKNADAEGNKKKNSSQELHPERLFAIKKKGHKLNYELSL